MARKANVHADGLGRFRVELRLRIKEISAYASLNRETVRKIENGDAVEAMSMSRYLDFLIAQSKDANLRESLERVRNTVLGRTERESQSTLIAAQSVSPENVGGIFLDVVQLISVRPRAVKRADIEMILRQLPLLTERLERALQTL